MSDPEDQWKKCDADGAGKVLFDEFCNWAIKLSLDLDDDDDVTDSDIGAQDLYRRDVIKDRLKDYNQDQKLKS